MELDGEGVPRKRGPTVEAESKLDEELTAAYVERRKNGSSAGWTATMRDLRQRAEKLARRTAAIGVPGDFVAPLPGGLRVITGDTGATVLDASSAPVGWFDVSRPTGICPPCGSNAKTIVALPLAARVVALVPQRYAGGGILVDLETMQTKATVSANLWSIAVAPGHGQLAFVELDYDDSVPARCRGQLVVASPDGTVQRKPPFLPPKDFCQGQNDASWRTRAIVLSSEWSDELLTVDVASGVSSHAKKPASHKDDPRPHASRVLCGKDRERIKASACSVASRWAFPAVVCAGATTDADENASIVCAPGFQGL
jgi:hypothetical protein